MELNKQSAQEDRQPLNPRGILSMICVVPQILVWHVSRSHINTMVANGFVGMDATVGWLAAAGILSMITGIVLGVWGIRAKGPERVTAALGVMLNALPGVLFTVYLLGQGSPASASLP